MSFLVLHMDKFKKDDIRGIQSHNKRERKSRSNPDIDYQRSLSNYELHLGASSNFVDAVRNRIDDLLLLKTVRKDAVHLCGLIVSSDSAFFKSLSPEETKRFFEESKAFLTKFVGKENVISAMVHMDEKTPHMHFLHVPVTQDGRLNAKQIYTRESLKKLQAELPRYLHSRGFILQRGVEQIQGAYKKHLNTREYKQQQEMLLVMQRDEAALRQRLQEIEQQVREAEKILNEKSAIPEASVFTFKSVIEQARQIIERQKQALANKNMIATMNESMKTEIHALKEKVFRLEQQILLDRERNAAVINKLTTLNRRAHQTIAYFREFATQPEVLPIHREYVKRQEQARKDEEARKAHQQEQEEQHQKLKRELQQRQEESRRERQVEQSRSSMRMR